MVRELIIKIKTGAGREDRTLIKRLETSYNSHYTIPAVRVIIMKKVAHCFLFKEFYSLYMQMKIGMLTEY